MTNQPWFMWAVAGIGAIVLVAVIFFVIKKLKNRGPSVEELMQTAGDPDLPLEERLEALKKVEQFGMFADAAIPGLIVLMADRAEDIRNTAAEVLDDLDAEWAENEVAAEAVPGLVKAVSVSDNKAQVAGIKLLGRIGEAAAGAVPKLIKLLSADVRPVRLAAVEALGFMGAKAKEAVPMLVESLTAKEEDIRTTASESLIRIGTAAMPHLLKLLENDRQAVRLAAVDTLEQIDPEWGQSEKVQKIVVSLAGLVSDGFGPERVTSAQMLGDIGVHALQAIPDLVAVLADGDEGLRQAASDSLERIDPDWAQGDTAREAIAKLVGLLMEADPKVRDAALDILIRIDPEWSQTDTARRYIPEFVKALSVNLDNTRLAGAQALGMMGRGAAKSVPYLLKALTDTESAIRDAVAQSLEKIDPKWREQDQVKKAVPGLVKKTAHEKWQIRCAAASALGKIGPKALPALPHVVIMLVDADREVRNTVKTALKAIHPKWQTTEGVQKVLPLLIKRLGDPQWAMRLATLEALGEIGPPAGTLAPYVVKAKQDSVSDVTAAADKVLEMIDPEKKHRAQELDLKKRTTYSPIEEFLDGLKLESDPIPTLIRELVNSDRSFRTAALDALQKHDPKWYEKKSAINMIPFLEESLADGQWAIRHAAVTTLGSYGKHAAAVLPRLVKVSITDSTVDVQGAAKKALEKIDPGGALRKKL